jgi:hypothetical protein
MNPTLKDLREAYELSVRALPALARQLRQAGADDEAVARAVHVERRALALKYKALTPEPQRSRIEAHTIAAYGNPIGPTIEDLRARGRSWQDITESACRPGAPPKA